MNRSMTQCGLALVLVLAGCSSDAPTTASTPATASANTSAPSVSAAATAEYAPVAGPTIPASTSAIGLTATQADGVYYGTVAVGDPPPADGAVVFELVQLFTGAACTAQFPDDDDACSNDYGTLADPSATVEVPLTDQFISVTDLMTQKSYQVSGAELYRLITGGAPGPEAPEGYKYSPFTYLLTIAGGDVTRIEQWWTP